MKVIKFVLLVILIIYSSGCAKKENGKIVLKYMWTGYVKYDKIRIEQCRRFENKHPDVKVNYEIVSGVDLVNKVTTMTAAGIPTDVFAIYNPVIFEIFAKRGILLDLTNYVENDSEYKNSKVYPELLESYTYNGKLYALPANCGVDIMYYNKDLFDKENIKYPDKNWTWDNLAEAGRKLTRYENNTVRQFGLAIGIDWKTFMRQSGGKLWNKDKTECIINSEETKKALQFMQDCWIKHKIAPTILQNKEIGTNEDLFMMGKVAIFMGGRWYTALFKDIKAFKWDIDVLPRSPKGSRIAQLGSMAWGVSSKTKYPDIAYKFVKHLTGEEGEKFLVEVGDALPMRENSKLWNECFNEKERDVYQEALKSTYNEIEFINPKLQMSYSEFNDKIVWPNIEKIFLGILSIDQAISQIEKETKFILKTK